MSSHPVSSFRSTRRAKAAATLLSALAFVACSASDGSAPLEGGTAAEPLTPAPAGPGQVLVVRAGAAGNELGVERWEIEEERLLGIAADETVVADFRVHPRQFMVESVLPEPGVMSTDAAQPLNTLSPLAQNLLEAAQSDRDGVEGAERLQAPVVSSEIVGCFNSFDACNEEGQELVERGVFASCTCAFVSHCPIRAGIRLTCIRPIQANP